MATGKDKRNSGYFSGIPLDELLINPLVAVAKAQSAMVREQVLMLLKTCFRYKKDTDTFEPIMLDMSITRSYLVPDSDPSKPPKLNTYTADFEVPLITIIPISSLSIDHVELDFDIEITTQYSEADEEEEVIEIVDPDDEKSSRQNRLISRLSDNRPKHGISGKYSSEKVKEEQIMRERTFEYSKTSNFHIRVEAASQALPNGLLEIIDVYSKSIFVDKVKEDSSTNL